MNPGTHSLDIVEHDEPETASGTDVRVRMLEVGVCGTDREIAAFEYGDPPPGSDQLVIGHESIGRVLDVGPGVTPLQPGDLVVPTVRRPCPHTSCRPWRSWVYSRSPAPNEKAGVAEAVGARYISSETRSADQLRDEVGEIDLVYEAVGASKPAFEVLGVLGTNAVFVFTGVPGRKAPIEVDTDRLRRNLVLRNQVVLGSVNAGKSSFEAAVRHLEGFNRRWPDALDSLISRHPMESYEELLTGHSGGIKQVIEMAREAS